MIVKLKRFIKITIIGIVLVLLFCCDLDSTIDKLTFLGIFKKNIYWLEGLVSTFSDLIVFIIILVGICFVCIKMNVSLIGFKIAGFEMALKKPDMMVKSRVKNYLNTKRSLFVFLPEYDNIVEVFDSYHAIYDFLREQLLEFDCSKKQDSEVYDEIRVMLIELNTFLTSFQSEYRRWILKEDKGDEYIPLIELQKNYHKYDQLIEEFKKINDAMCKHAEFFDVDLEDWKGQRIVNGE